MLRGCLPLRSWHDAQEGRKAKGKLLSCAVGVHALQGAVHDRLRAGRAMAP